MSTINKNYSALVAERLERILVIRELSTADIVSTLLDENLASCFYDEKCFAVDRWFLFDRRKNFYKGYASCIEVVDPISHIWFRVVLQALVDYGAGRPCDCHVWVRDVPPDRMRCSPTVHICKNVAKKFLLSLTSPDLEFAGLSESTLQHYMSKLNGGYRNARLKS